MPDWSGFVWMGGEKLDSKNRDNHFEEQKNRVVTGREYGSTGDFFFLMSSISVSICWWDWPNKREKLKMEARWKRIAWLLPVSRQEWMESSAQRRGWSDKGIGSSSMLWWEGRWEEVQVRACKSSVLVVSVSPWCRKQKRKWENVTGWGERSKCELVWEWKS